MWKRRLDGDDEAQEQQLNPFAHYIFGNVGRRQEGVRRGWRIVDGVDGSQLLDDRLDGAGRLTRLGEIGLEGLGHHAFAAQLGGQDLKRFKLSRDKGDAVTFGAETTCQGSTQA